MSNFVNKEQRQALDTHIKEFFFFFKVGKDSFSDLDTAHITLGYIATNFSNGKDLTVKERNCVINGIYLFDNKAVSILLQRGHVAAGRHLVKVIVYLNNSCFSVDTF